MSIVEIISSLSWRPIPSKIGNLGKATLPPQMTIAEALSLANQNITLDGKSLPYWHTTGIPWHFPDHCIPG